MGRKRYGEEVGAFAGAVCVVSPDVLCEGGTPCSGIVASCWVFNLDNFCPKTSQPSQTMKKPRKEQDRFMYSKKGIQCLPTQGLPISECSMAIIPMSMPQSLDESLLSFRLTPARTLVISSTRIPANGSFEVSGAAVACPRILVCLDPMLHPALHSERRKALRALWQAIQAPHVTLQEVSMRKKRRAIESSCQRQKDALID